MPGANASRSVRRMRPELVGALRTATWIWTSAAAGLWTSAAAGVVWTSAATGVCAATAAGVRTPAGSSALVSFI